MGGQEHLVAALHQSFHGRQIIAHMALRRRHDGGVPAHDVVAGEDGARADQRKAQMVGRVTWCVNDVQGPIIALDRVAVPELLVGHESFVDEGAAGGAGRAGAARLAGRTVGQDGRARARL